MYAASTGLPRASYALTAGPVKAQNVFLGANVFMSGFGGHRCVFLLLLFATAVEFVL